VDSEVIHPADEEEDVVLRCIRLAVAAVIGAACVLSGPAVPAVADYPHGGGDPERVAEMVGPDSVSPKEATARCPDDTYVFAAGARVVDGNGRVVLTSIVPDQATRSVTVSAKERNGYQGVWSLVAFAVCDWSVSRPGIVSETAYGDTTVTASCPGETRLTGVGFSLAGSVESIGVREVAFGPGLRDARVGVGGSDTLVGLTAYGICKWPTQHGGPPGVVVHNPGTADAGWPKVATAGDSTLDMRLYAVGATVTGPGDAFLTGLVPNLNQDLAVAEATRGTTGTTAARRLAVSDDGDDGSLSVSGLFMATFH
jgi:hypothetical protein